MTTFLSFSPPRMSCRQGHKQGRVRSAGHADGTNHTDKNIRRKSGNTRCASDCEKVASQLEAIMQDSVVARLMVCRDEFGPSRSSNSCKLNEQTRTGATVYTASL